MNPTDDDAQKPEIPTELTENIMTLKLDIQYWTWPRGKVPQPKVHHSQKGVGTLPRLYTDVLGFYQISYNFKTGVQDVFEIIYFFLFTYVGRRPAQNINLCYEDLSNI